MTGTYVSVIYIYIIYVKKKKKKKKIKKIRVEGKFGGKFFGEGGKLSFVIFVIERFCDLP